MKKIFSTILICLLIFSILQSSAISVSADWKKENSVTKYEENGKYVTGWKTIDGKKYYFNADGSMQTKNATISGIRYKFLKTGVNVGKYSGWVTSGSKRYYCVDGLGVEGWQKVNEKWLYFKTRGLLVTTSAKFGETTYAFKSNGEWDFSKNKTAPETVIQKSEKALTPKKCAGIYMDGIMAIDVNEAKAIVNKLYPDFPLIIYVEAKYSSEQLKTTKDLLWDNRGKYGINSASTNVKENRVEITVDKITDELIAYKNSLPYGGCVFVTKDSTAITDDYIERVKNV